MPDLERTIAVIEAGVADNTHIGAQLSVSHDGIVTDFVTGMSRPGVSMMPDSLMIWFSMSKAVCAVAITQLWEQGKVRIDEPVQTYLPEFGAGGKECVTLRHLLTHTGGFPWADGILQGKVWRESVEENRKRIYASPLENDWVPGERAGYHATSGHTVLGAIVEAVDGRSYDRYVREEIFLPLGMNDSWVGLPPDRYDEYGDLIGLMQNTAVGGGPSLIAMETREVAAMRIPGANGRGPMRDLRKLYEMFLGEGTRNGVSLLSPQTVAAIGARHRVGLLDETFGIVLDWGLGLSIDGYIMGRHSSVRAFGHGGSQSSAAYCDPENDLAVAVVCNGMPGGDRHSVRMDQIATALYEDLGLAVGKGRVKPYPTTSL